MAAPAPAFKRVLLKLSGEALAGNREFGIDPQRLGAIADEIVSLRALQVEIALVLGGGNFFRGVALQAKQMDRVAADHMGMLATVINGLAMQDALESRGWTTRVMSAIQMHQVAEPFIRRRAIRHLEKGRVVIFAAGTGNPYFTTDSAASLRALEVGAQILLKASHHVDGVYDRDPMLDHAAQRFDHLTYLDILSRNLKVMDSTAISMCRDNNLPVLVFNLRKGGNIKRAVMGEQIGTLVSES